MFWPWWRSGPRRATRTSCSIRCRRLKAPSRGPRTSNFSFYRNPRLDDLLIRASQLSFKPERQKLYIRAQAMLAEDVPWIPIYVRLHWAVARPEVRNLRLHASGNHRLDRVTIEAPAAASTPGR